MYSNTPYFDLLEPKNNMASPVTCVIFLISLISCGIHEVKGYEQTKTAVEICVSILCNLI